MPKTDDNYDEMSEELSDIIQSLQSGESNLDQSVKKYERGIELISKLEKYLKEVENKITKLKTTKS